MGLVAGCGFQPLARIDSLTTSNGRIRLADIVYRVDLAREASRFRYYLDREIAKSIDISPESNDTLDLRIDIEREGLAIEQDDSITRLNLTATVQYQLKNSSGEEVFSGQTVSISALNATSSQFTTSIAERNALERLATDVSQRVVTVLRLNADALGT